jgi:hypothetical protein
MIKAVLNRLKNDAALSSLLGVTAEDSRIYPLSTGNFGPCISYTDTPMEGGRVKQNNLELRITAQSYAATRQIEDRLNALLDFKEGSGEDTGWIYEDVNVMTSYLTGGGELEMGEIYQRFLVYTIKWRNV